MLMTEAEWLGGDDPGAMLDWLTGNPRVDPAALAVLGSVTTWCPLRPSARKLRLFAVACSRLHGTYAGRTVPEIAAEHAETAARAEAWADTGARGRVETHDGAWWMMEEDAAEAARRLCEAPGKGAQVAALVREVFGNPFRPVTLPLLLRSAIVGWEGGIIRRVAGGIYEERLPDGTLDPARLAVLSDALEEAGCTDESLLRHLRGQQYRICTADNCGRGAWEPHGGPHVRGCWALDLILGKE